MTVGERIKNFRKKKGISIIELCEMLNNYAEENGIAERDCHFEKSKLSRIENESNGQTINKVGELIALSAVLGVSADRLLFGGDPDVINAIGLRDSALDALKADREGLDEKTFAIATKAGITYAELINFFFDNGLIDLLDSLRSFIQIDIAYELAADDVFGSKGTSTMPKLTTEEWEEVYFSKLKKSIMNARHIYRKKQLRKMMGGEDNGKKSKW